MSNENRTSFPFLSSHWRDRAAHGIRWTWVVFASLTLGTLPGCVDAPSTPDFDPSEALTERERLSEVARGVASAMESAEIRSRVLEAMRASPRVDHSLILGEHLGEARARGLLNASARALNLSVAEFLSLVRELPELEFVVPSTEHRLTWTGTPGIALGAMWGSDEPDFTVYEPSGVVRRIMGARALQQYEADARQRFEALFVIRPSETMGTRIGRQADVPGPVIQDPDDGEDAIVVSYQIGNREPISFDIGRFSDVAAARRAIEREMAREFALASAEQSNIYADGHTTCQEHPEDPDCVDCNEMPWHPICPPRPPPPPPPPPSYVVGYSPTHLNEYILVRNLDPTGDSEIRMVLSYMSAPGIKVTATYTNYDVVPGRRYIHRPPFNFLNVHPVEDGSIFILHVVELDRGSPDDDLGVNQIEWDESGEWQEFDENGDNVADFKVNLSW
jgi:hypothetical protein